MSEEEFFNRAINRICKDYDYYFATELKNIYLRKDKQLQQKENTIKEARELIKTGASYCENGCIDDLSINDCNKILEILDKENI